MAGALLVSTLALARALPVLARVTALAIGEALLATAVLAPVSDETVGGIARRRSGPRRHGRAGLVRPRAVGPGVAVTVVLAGSGPPCWR